MDAENVDTGNWLTAKAAKRDLYARDPYFQEAWADARDLWGAHVRIIARQIAVIVFKPETVVTRRIPAALAFLRERDFVPLLSRPIHYTRHMNRAAWRYQYQRDLPTTDRLAVNDLILSATPALCVVLHDTTTETTQGASVRLNTYKGSMTPALRSGDDLRSLVGGPNRMLSGVHIPDEPADVLRELAILFAVGERRALFTEVVTHLDRDHDGASAVLAAVDALSAHYPPVTLDPPAALARLDAALAPAASPDTKAATDALRQLVAAVRRGEPLPWQQFEAECAHAGLVVPLWDRILLGTEYIRHTEAE